MKTLFVNMHFGSRHGESIAGLHMLRSLHDVSQVSAVVSYDNPLPEAWQYYDLPEFDRWCFPRPPGIFAGRRGREIRRWLREYRKHAGWRRRIARRDASARDCKAIVVNGGSALHVCADLLDSRRCPALLVVHAPARRLLGGADPEEGKQAFLRRARSIDGLIFVSRGVEADWIEAGLVQDRRTFYLSNCCDEESVVPVAAQDRAALRRQLGLPVDREIVIVLARVTEVKGQDLVVAQMRNLLRRRPNLQVICVGRVHDLWGTLDDRWGRALVQRVAESDFAERCLFLGEKPNALEYLRAADLLLLPSRSEALPLVLLEAMTLKVPIVAAAVDGIPEAVVDGETGLLFASEDSEAMADAIDRVLASPPLGQSLTASGFDRYWGHFSREQQKRRLAGILDDLAG